MEGGILLGHPIYGVIFWVGWTLNKNGTEEKLFIEYFFCMVGNMGEMYGRGRFMSV
jgi:hypothetical protein